MNNPAQYIFRVISVLLLVSFFGIHVDAKEPSPKNVILVIGDGMGLNQVQLLRQYLQHGKNSSYRFDSSALKKLSDNGTTALATTEAFQSLTTDSAASATHLASGEVSRQKMIGISHEGEKVKTLLERAKNAGKSIGVISDTRLTHATPAAFLAHEQYREQETDIAAQMIAAKPDLMLSAGSSYFLPNDITSANSKTYAWTRKNLPKALQMSGKRSDGRNLLKEASDSGVQLVFSRKDLKEKAKTNQPVLGLFFANQFPDAIERSQDKNKPNRTYPMLSEMTEAALQKLSHNENGFVLMVEAGQIDWAGHRNDAGWLLHEMLHFEDTLKVITDFVEKRKDTLLVVTADHETGGLSWSYKYSDVPKAVKLQKDLKGKKHKYTSDPLEPALLDQLYSQKKSSASIVREFMSLSKKEQKAGRLQKMMNEAFPFKVSKKTAKRILKTRKFKIETRDGETTHLEVPHFDEQQPFYASAGLMDRTGLMGRYTSAQSGIVWGTGGHTGSPVPVFAYGPGAETFKGFYHNIEINKKIRELTDL